jgi:DNA-binding CsgD family transcriptional regulator
MVRSLVQRARESSIPPTHARHDEPMLLDLEVDGVRCMLVSKPSTQAILLSPREREIARMVANGYPNKTIASVLDISCWTVGTHLRRVFSKLNVTSRAAMVAKVLAEGLLGSVAGEVVQPGPDRPERRTIARR